MKNLLQTHSISWAQSVKLTLESEGIEAVVLDENAPGYMGFAGRVRVAVLDDDDLARAQQLLAGLAPPPVEAPPSWRWQKRGIKMVAFGFLLMIVFGVLLNEYGRYPLVLGVAGASAAALVVGFALIVLGPRADRQSGERKTEKNP